jgi:two-component system sensor histidine kinase HydH
MEEKILHLDKLAALGRFSSSMAHEIRNPLTGIVAGIQYLNRIGGIPEDQTENIRFILKEVNRIDRLISDILNVVRPGDLVYHPVHIESIITGAITGMQDISKKKSVRIRANFPVHTRSVTIDSDRVTVKVAFPVDNNIKDVLFDDMQNLVIIEVEDEGVGFAEDEKGKIFEPFFTTKAEGTGLGLYVTHSIVEQHGGYIFVESEEGRGSTFTIYLPVEKVQHGDTSEISHPLGR